MYIFVFHFALCIQSPSFRNWLKLRETETSTMHLVPLAHTPIVPLSSSVVYGPSGQFDWPSEYIIPLFIARGTVSLVRGHSENVLSVGIDSVTSDSENWFRAKENKFTNWFWTDKKVECIRKYSSCSCYIYVWSQRIVRDNNFVSNMNRKYWCFSL